MDLAAFGFERAESTATGRLGYHPCDLLKLYVYGCLHRVRSSRRLEAEAARNLEVIWLFCGLRPDFKTIADFRKDNRPASKACSRLATCSAANSELFGAKLVAIDGAKFKAVNSPKRHYISEQMAELGGHDEFLCRGLAMARAEFSLSEFSYNLRRALNVLGVETLLAGLPASA